MAVAIDKTDDERKWPELQRELDKPDYDDGYAAYKGTILGKKPPSKFLDSIVTPFISKRRRHP